jgi:hypothetical protein
MRILSLRSHLKENRMMGGVSHSVADWNEDPRLLEIVRGSNETTNAPFVFLRSPSVAQKPNLVGYLSRVFFSSSFAARTSF